jgi:hypothetical protein
MQHLLDLADRARACDAFARAPSSTRVGEADPERARDITEGAV